MKSRKDESPFTGEAVGPGDLPTAGTAQTGKVQLPLIYMPLMRNFCEIIQAAPCGYAVGVRAS